MLHSEDSIQHDRSKAVGLLPGHFVKTHSDCQYGSVRIFFHHLTYSLAVIDRDQGASALITRKKLCGSRVTEP